MSISRIVKILWPRKLQALLRVGHLIENFGGIIFQINSDFKRGKSRFHAQELLKSKGGDI